MKTRFSSKTSTRLAAVIAVIAVMGSFAGCSATVTSDTTGARETTAATEAETEAATEETTEETTTEAADDETTAPQADNGTPSFPEKITSIDDNLFGITIPLYGDDDSNINYMVNIREGDIIEAGSEYNSLIPPGPVDADVVYIVYNEGFNSDDMDSYCDQFVDLGYSIEWQNDNHSAFSTVNEDGYRVVCQTLENTTTVGIYNYANNPEAAVVGIG